MAPPPASIILGMAYLLISMEPQRYAHRLFPDGCSGGRYRPIRLVDQIGGCRVVDQCGQLAIAVDGRIDDLLNIAFDANVCLNVTGLTSVSLDGGRYFPATLGRTPCNHHLGGLPWPWLRRLPGRCLWWLLSRSLPCHPVFSCRLPLFAWEVSSLKCKA